MEARRLACPRLCAAVRGAAADLFRLYTASLAGALNRASRAPGAGDGARERWALGGPGGLGWAEGCSVALRSSPP